MADAQALRRALDDPDEQVRSEAAVGLAELGDTQALDALIRTIDDAPDPLHLDVTPSVRALGAYGPEAIPRLLDLLDAPEELTRLHAQRALELAVYRRHGFVAGEGFPTAEAEEAARDELGAGGYDYEAEPSSRRPAIQRLRARLGVDGAPAD
jgi:HEAT repeat protein